MKFRNLFSYFSKFEWTLWLTSISTVTISFFFSNTTNPLNLIASLIGVTALIFLAKGNVIGQILTIVFGLIYAIISYQYHYYGEMITYLGMTAPIALLSAITWLKHPYENKKMEVEVTHLKKSQIQRMIIFSIIVTFIFYFILNFFNTANLVISTISITTSFLASYLMLYRNPTYALAYAANDIVLIILWVLACFDSISHLPVVICFFMFFFNDIYAFFNWKRIHNKQKQSRLSKNIEVNQMLKENA